VRLQAVFELCRLHLLSASDRAKDLLRSQQLLALITAENSFARATSFVRSTSLDQEQSRRRAFFLTMLFRRALLLLKVAPVDACTATVAGEFILLVVTTCGETLQPLAAALAAAVKDWLLKHVK
jgi:hypothetical protein